MKKFFQKNWPALVIYVILFLVPLFWFDFGKVDYGGDSNRLYFYDPLSWLKNIALYTTNPLTSLGQDVPNFTMIPFLSFLTVLKVLFFHTGYSLNNFFNGLLLSGSFISIYFIIIELIRPTEEERKYIVFPAIISGLFFSLSPILSMQWERSLYSISGVFIYPLVFLLFLKYLNTEKYFYLAVVLIVCFIFSVNFSFATIPWFFAFFPLAFLFLFIYSIFNKNTKTFLKGIAVLLVLLVLILSFDIVIQVYGLINPFGLNSKMLSGSGRALSYFLSIQSHVRLIYNLLNQDQYVISNGFSNPFAGVIFNFGIKYLPFFSFYPLTVFWGIILVKKNELRKLQRLLILVLSFFLILLYLITSNITGLGTALYKNLFRIPLFGMFRSFYSKFGMVYVFFYAILIGICLFLIFSVVKSKFKRVLFIIISLVLIIFNGWPLLSGKMAKGTLWRSKNLSYANEIDPQYQKFIDRIKEEKADFKVMSFPFANEDYQVLQGKTEGVYFGPSTIPILAGKNAFSGQTGFSIFWPFLQSYIDQGKFQEAKKLLSLLNIGYIFYNNDEYIYNNFPNYPYSDWLKQNFTNQEAIKKLVDNFGFEKIYNLKTYNLYRLEEQFILPHIYIPKQIIFSTDGVEIIPQSINIGNIDPRPLYFLEKLNSGVPRGMFNKEETNVYFVDGKNSDIDNLELVNRLTGAGALFVSIKETSYLQLIINTINEKLKETELSGDKYSIFTEKLTNANKRLNAAASYKKKVDFLFKLYKKNILDNLKTIKEEKDLRLQLEYVLILKNNLSDGLTRLEKNTPPNFKSWEFMIKGVLREIENYVPVFSISQKNYILNVPKSGRYRLFVSQPTLFLAENLANSTNGCALEIVSDDGKIDKFVLKPQIEKSSIVNFGEFDFTEGERKIYLNLCKLENQLVQSDWNVYENDEKASSIRTENEPQADYEKYKIPESQLIYYKKINNWEPESWYEISGKAYGNSNLKIAIGEERQRWVVSHLKLKLLNKFDIVRTENIQLDSNGKNFKFYLKSSPLSKSAEIFFYYDKVAVGEKEKPFLEIEEANIIPALNPRATLRSIDSGEGNNFKTIPKLTFLKINPTGYQIKVEGASSPYFLVFSDSFHPGWQLYLKGNINSSDRKDKTKEAVRKLITSVGRKLFNKSFLENKDNIVASYFNGEIQESKHQNLFLEPTTFDTWGEKPLVDERNHFVVNGYANSWYITPNDVSDTKDYELILEFKPQRMLYIGSLISLLTIIGCLVFFFLAAVRSIFKHATKV